MDSINQEMSNLADLKRTLSNATEALAAFISTARSDERPIASLIEAAEKALPDLHEWRKTIETAVDMFDRDAVH